MKILLPTPHDTTQLAQRMARFIQPGDTLLLHGELGAGKSHFARAFIQALGCKQQHIPSPTFTLVQTYDDTRLPVAHADLYRLKSATELTDLDLDDYFTHGVCLVEWPERAAGALPPQALNLYLSVTPEGARMAELDGNPAWQKRLAQMLQTPISAAEPNKNYAAFAAAQGFADAKLTPLGGDASARRYLRVEAGARAAIMMDVPPVMVDEDGDVVDLIANHQKLNRYLAQLGLRVGEVYGVDQAQKLLLQEDLGQKNLYDFYAGQVQAPWLQVAVEALVRLAKAKPLEGLKPFTLERMQRNVCLYTDWYLPRLRGQATAPDERKRFLEAWAQVYAQFKEVPWGVQLRDYHSPNFMVLGPTPCLENLALIDYQDATFGPLAFDLASLLYDARIAVPACLRSEMLEYFLTQTGFDVARFEASFYLISLMRNTRILGIFVRLAERDGKTQYLEKIPILLPYIHEALQHPAAAPLRPWLQKVEKLAA